MKKITVFTPTFNRINLLENVYKSLLNQTSKDFIWLIIDDGSTDNTENVVKRWIEEKKISIKYYKKENGGKHSAYNYALNKIDTEYFIMALDSDDTFVKEAIEYFEKCIEELPKDYVGVVCLRSDNSCNRDKTCKKYDTSVLNGKSLRDSLINNLFNAECTFLFKTEYLVNFLFPIYKNEKFFTEAYLYYQMNGKMLWKDKITTIGEYLDDGLTKNKYKLFLNNPRSWKEFNYIRFTSNKNLILKIKYLVYYISFSIISKLTPFTESFKVNSAVVILYPLGLLGSILLKNKR